MALAALVLTIATFAAIAAPVALAGDQVVPACGKNTLPNNKHCVAPAPMAEITLVTSDAPCSVTIAGNMIQGYDYIDLDFDSLILTSAGYTSALVVYQPGNALNDAGTTVTNNADGTVTVTNNAICGKNLIVTTGFFNGGAYGTSYYETVVVQA